MEWMSILILGHKSCLTSPRGRFLGFPDEEMNLTFNQNQFILCAISFLELRQVGFLLMFLIYERYHEKVLHKNSCMRIFVMVLFFCKDFFFLKLNLHSKEDLLRNFAKVQIRYKYHVQV